MSDSQPIDLSAARAARLAALVPVEAAPLPVNGWRWRVIGHEVQLRSKALPHLRLDLTTSEAADLAEVLGMAVFDSLTRPVVSVSIWRRVLDWLARRTWNRKHEFERSEALKKLAEEFAEGGGW